MVDSGVICEVPVIEVGGTGRPSTSPDKFRSETDHLRSNQGEDP